MFTSNEWRNFQRQNTLYLTSKARGTHWSGGIFQNKLQSHYCPTRPNMCIKYMSLSNFKASTNDLTHNLLLFVIPLLDWQSAIHTVAVFVKQWAILVLINFLWSLT